MEADSIRNYFYTLAELISERLKPGEIFTCLLRGESSEFVRLNNDRIRQAGHVRQQELRLDLIEGRRHAAARFNVTGDLALDRPTIENSMQSLRSQRKLLGEDPYLLIATKVLNSENIQAAPALDTKDIVAQIIDISAGLDLVGIWASGNQFQGFANTYGQRNWHSVDTFNFDWSCYFSGDKAVKANYAGTQWDVGAFERRIDTVRTQLQLFERPTHTLKPGRYRTYLAPPALHEILALIGWGGFGLKSHRTLQTPLIKMIQQRRSMHPNIQIIANRASALVPEFTPAGFIKPDQITLIQNGKYQDCLVSPRSSIEYSVPVNASSEAPESLDMAAGEIVESQLLGQLDTGLYISNLWYSNFSDRNDCRITGMTRYACFWVEHGEIAAPINAMRFDDSLYHILGDKLIGLTDNQELLMDPSTYQSRHLSVTSLPGALLEEFQLTL